MKDYASFDNHLLTEQFKRQSHKISNITLKKLQIVIKQYNEQRLELAEILKQLDKRGMVGKMPQGIEQVSISTSDDKSDETSDKNK